MKSVMNHNFNQIPSVNIERSVFNRSHGNKLTLNEGYLVPIFVDEVLPGDTFSLGSTLFGRLSSPLKLPIMDNIFMEQFYFYVPTRIIWENWEKICGAAEPTEDPLAGSDYIVPQMSPPSGGFLVGSVADYFGIPLGVEGENTPADFTVSSLHFRAYNKIWNDWFRDQNMQDTLDIYRSGYPDGPDDPDDYPLQKRGKRHDYFTSGLPWPQKGPGVEIPLGSSAPVIGNGITIGLTGFAGTAGMFTTGAGSSSMLQAKDSAYNQATGEYIGGGGGTYGYPDTTIGLTTNPGSSGMIADLSSATAATINSFRQAFQIQKLFERDARGGTRYVEILKSHFGVTSPDFRLQRSEYLGGGSARVNINPVQQTGVDGMGASFVGTLAAFGTMQGHSGFSKSFTEHGVIIGLVNFRGDITYQSGLNKMFSRRTRYDYYWPSFAHLGEQAILQKEIYATGVVADDEKVFAYQERYAEYRYKPSTICGLFRSYSAPGVAMAGTLDAYHLSQKFSAAPELEEAFIIDNTPISRVVQVPSQDHFMLDCYFDLKCARPMPVYSVPGLIDHF